MKVFQQKRLLLFGIGGGLIANLFLRLVLLLGGGLRDRPRRTLNNRRLAKITLIDIEFTSHANLVLTTPRKRK